MIDSVECYTVSKDVKESCVSKLSLVDGIDPYTLTPADLVEDIECLPLLIGKPAT